MNKQTSINEIKVTGDNPVNSSSKGFTGALKKAVEFIVINPVKAIIRMTKDSSVTDRSNKDKWKGNSNK